MHSALDRHAAYRMSELLIMYASGVMPHACCSCMLVSSLERQSLLTHNTNFESAVCHVLTPVVSFPLCLQQPFQAIIFTGFAKRALCAEYVTNIERGVALRYICCC